MLDSDFHDHDIGVTEEIFEKMSFIIPYTSKDLARRRMLYVVAFLVVFISILSSLLIDVFVKKGSLIFIKMSEDLEIDAEITAGVTRGHKE